MANEIRYGCGLTIVKSSANIKQIDNDAIVVTDMLGSRGPAIGSVMVPTSGYNVDLEATLQYLGGMCKMKNKGVNLVVAGVFDPSTSHFFSFLDLIPDEPQVVRLSRYLCAEFAGTGTGSLSSPQTQFWLVAENATTEVHVEAYDR